MTETTSSGAPRLSVERGILLVLSAMGCLFLSMFLSMFIIDLDFAGQKFQRLGLMQLDLQFTCWRILDLPKGEFPHPYYHLPLPGAILWLVAVGIFPLFLFGLLVRWVTRIKNRRVLRVWLYIGLIGLIFVLGGMTDGTDRRLRAARIKQGVETIVLQSVRWDMDYLFVHEGEYHYGKFKAAEPEHPDSYYGGSVSIQLQMDIKMEAYPNRAIIVKAWLDGEYVNIYPPLALQFAEPEQLCRAIVRDIEEKLPQVNSCSITIFRQLQMHFDKKEGITFNSYPYM